MKKKQEPVNCASTRRWSWIVFLALIGVFFSTLTAFYMSLHVKNDCGMTYMWRAMQFLPLDVLKTVNYNPKYQLYIYNEGPEYFDRRSLRPYDIPVLFIPGSGGRYTQVRSIASVVQNKTEMAGSPFRFRFFAVDFNEELTFVSGHILYIHTRFVADCIETIKKMMKRDDKKIILYGHSFGGTVAMTLATLPHFDPSSIDLIFTVSAPLAYPPITTNRAMKDLMRDMQRIWRKKVNDTLDHIGVLSYSSGIKDILVHDWDAHIEETIPRPAWSVPGVPDVGADHLCMLWCNQLVRHTARIIYAYGEKKQKSTGKYMLLKFLYDEGTFDKLYMIVALFETLILDFDSTCVKNVSIIDLAGLTHTMEMNRGKGQIQIYRKNNQFMKIEVSGTKDCEYTVTLIEPALEFVWVWYEMLALNIRALTQHIIMALSRWITFFTLKGRHPWLNRWIYAHDSWLPFAATFIFLMTTYFELDDIAPILVAEMIVYPYALLVTRLLGPLCEWVNEKSSIRVRTLAHCVFCALIVTLKVFLPPIGTHGSMLLLTSGLTVRATLLSIPLVIVAVLPHIYDTWVFTAFDAMNFLVVMMHILRDRFPIIKVDLGDDVRAWYDRICITFILIHWWLSYVMDQPLQGISEVVLAMLSFGALFTFGKEKKEPVLAPADKKEKKKRW